MLVRFVVCACGSGAVSVRFRGQPAGVARCSCASCGHVAQVPAPAGVVLRPGYLRRGSFRAVIGDRYYRDKPFYRACAARHSSRIPDTSSSIHHHPSRYGSHRIISMPSSHAILPPPHPPDSPMVVRDVIQKQERFSDLCGEVWAYDIKCRCGNYARLLDCWRLELVPQVWYLYLSCSKCRNRFHLYRRSERKIRKEVFVS